jgi:hypothetical protein
VTASAHEDRQLDLEDPTARLLDDGARAPTVRRARPRAGTSRGWATREDGEDSVARGRGAVYDEVAWNEGDMPADERSYLGRHVRLRRARRGEREIPPQPLRAAIASVAPGDARSETPPRDRVEELGSLAQQAAGAQRRGFPRAIWLGAAIAAVLWQVAAGRAGIALLLVAAIVPLLAIARRSSGSWLLAGLAPLLGVAGLAGAFPAIAGQLREWRTRAAVGALGYWWLTLAGPLAHERLWLAAPRALPPQSVWETSLSHALHVLAPMLSIGVVLGAGVWAAGALVLPLLARGRSAVADAIAVAAWSLALALAARALDGPLPAGVTHASPRGAVIGALLGAAIALGARAMRGPV